MTIIFYFFYLALVGEVMGVEASYLGGVRHFTLGLLVTLLLSAWATPCKLPLLLDLLRLDRLDVCAVMG